MIKLYLICAALFFLGLLVQDFGPSQMMLGKLGASLSIFAMPAWLFTAALVKSERRIFFGCMKPLMLIFGFFIFYQFITSIVNLTWLLPYESRQQVLWIKAIKVCVTFLVWVCVVMLGGHLALVAPRRLKQLSILVYIILGLGVLYEALSGSFLFTGWESVHYINPHQYRFRLLTPEASLLGALIASLAFIGLILADKKSTKIFLMLTCLPLLILVQSRGTLLSFVLAFALVAFTSSTRWFGRNLVVEVVLRITVLCLCVMVSALTYKNLIDKMDEHTSVATRSVFALSTWYSLTINPFGSGWSGYLVNGDSWLEAANNRLGGEFTSESETELDQLTNSDNDEAFAAKNLLSSFVWWGGIPGLLSFGGMMLLMLAKFHQTNNVECRLAIAFVCISLMTYETSLYQYSTPILIGLLLAIPAKCQKKITSMPYQNENIEGTNLGPHAGGLLFGRVEFIQGYFR